MSPCCAVGHCPRCEEPEHEEPMSNTVDGYGYKIVLTNNLREEEAEAHGPKPMCEHFRGNDCRVEALTACGTDRRRLLRVLLGATDTTKPPPGFGFDGEMLEGRPTVMATPELRQSAMGLAHYYFDGPPLRYTLEAAWAWWEKMVFERLTG